MSFLGISSTPTLAFALTQLDASYTGNLIEVVRSSDSATANIGIVSGKLDTSTLLSFAANTNAYVTTWYNQNGSSNHAVQNVVANMPQIVTSGALTATMFGEPAVLFNNTMLTTPTYWANSAFSMIMSFNDYSSNGNYMTLISTPFTTGSNLVSLGTFSSQFDLQNLGQSDSRGPVGLNYVQNQDTFITWVSSTGWTSGGTMSTSPDLLFPSPNTGNYPFPTSTPNIQLTYPSQTIVNSTNIGGNSSNNSKYHISAIVSFPSDLSSSDLQTAYLNVANAIGIPITGPAYQYSTLAEVLGTNGSNAQIVSATAEVPTFNISNARVASITLEVLCSVVNAAVLPSGYNSYVSVIES